MNDAMARRPAGIFMTSSPSQGRVYVPGWLAELRAAVR